MPPTRFEIGGIPPREVLREQTEQSENSISDYGVRSDHGFDQPDATTTTSDIVVSDSVVARTTF